MGITERESLGDLCQNRRRIYRWGMAMTIECEEFYNLMQNYRHWPVTDQNGTQERYAEVIRYIEDYVENCINAYADDAGPR